MKLATTLLLSVAFASVAFAGPVDYGKTDKGVVPPPPPADCFGAGLAVGLFGAAEFPSHRDERDNGGGGGALVEYFFNPYIGIQASYTATSPEPVHHEYAGELILRYPIQQACVAPYLLVGGGGIANSSNYGFFNAGVGIEARINPHFGIFLDGTYNWANQSDRDFTLVRLGVKFPF